MAKRGATDNANVGGNKRPRFPQAAQLAVIFEQMDSGMIVRDNTQFLANLSRLATFNRPMQLGKSTFLALAELVYSKKECAPAKIANNIPANKRNAGYVIRFDFLKVIYPRTNKPWQEDLMNIDKKLRMYVERHITRYLNKNEELKKYYDEPKSEEGEILAGDYLNQLSEAVKDFSEAERTEEFFVVLVDEYDHPLRDILFELLLDQPSKGGVVNFIPNYVSFFQSCKLVGQESGENKVCVTGIVPIPLDLISKFKAQNMTFDEKMLDAVGLRGEDVDNMLQQVHEFQPFASTEEMDKVRDAIRDHANHLQFLTGVPLYHTRMVNELMEVIVNPPSREAWLADTSRLPGSVTLEDAPSAIYKLLQTSNQCRKIAKCLVSQRDIFGTLNTKLNFVDVAQPDISENDYLTLLVHLGVASVRVNTAGEGHVFRATSRHFRSKYLDEMLGVTLKPLFTLSSAEEIHNSIDLLQDFVESLPASGMERMINWAKCHSTNHILELQFQGFLVGAVHEHFLADHAPVDATQEDKLGSKLRTDVRMTGNSTMIVLELKQKPSVQAKPTGKEMSDHHCQLYNYVQEIVAEKKYEIVAGFVVVMYANGTKFQIEQTTYPNEPEGYAAWKAKRKK